MNRIMLQRQSVHRKFISFRQEHDGSLYITFNRKGITNRTEYYRITSLESTIEELKVVEGQIPKKFEIHYHTTGRVNFKDTENPNIFGEPITAITQNFWFASLIIPDFDRLELHTGSLTETDFVLPVEGIGAQRIQYDLCISPFGAPITSYGLVKGHFSYPNLYTLNVIESDQPIPPMYCGDTKFSFVSPREGLFKSQRISREAAHIQYQQMRIGHKGPIIFGPNRENVYRLIFPVPATDPPVVNADFKVRGRKLEVLSVSKSEVTFKIHDVHGAVVKEPAQFSLVKLGEHRLTIQ
jgi:hypothetical protein